MIKCLLISECRTERLNRQSEQDWVELLSWLQAEDCLQTVWTYIQNQNGANGTIVKTVWKSKFRSAENAERYWKEGWDLASSYVLRPHLGIKWSQILDGVEKNLEKEWNERVQKDYRINV